MPAVDPLHRPIGRLLRAAQTADPGDLVDTLSMAVAELGGFDVVLFLIDYEHVTLVPHPDTLPHGGRVEPSRERVHHRELRKIGRLHPDVER